MLAQLRRRLADTPITFVPGNHEDRLDKFIANSARALKGLEGLSLPEQMKARQLKIDYRGGMYAAGACQIGPVSFRHGEIARKHSAYSAKGEYEDKARRTLVMGHTHRQGMFCVSTGGPSHWAVEGGCLCEDAEYDPNPNWQRGFVVVEIFDDFAVPKIYRIVNDMCLVDGEIIDKRKSKC